MPALLLMIVRSFVPRRCSAAIRCSGMPHRPKPPIMMDAPSWITATASSADANTLFMRRSYLLPAVAAAPHSRLLQPRRFQDSDRRRQALRFGIRRHVGRGRRRLNLPNDVHTRYHASECGEALAIGIARPAEIERRLIVDADEPARRRAIRRAARHRDHAILMENPGLAGALECDRRKAVLGAIGIDAGLDHLDFHRALRLIVHLDGAVPHPAVVMARVDIAEEIRRGCRRLRLIDFDDDVAELGLDADANR